MSSGIINIIKQASMDAMNNAQMCDIRYGTVTSVSPLKVQITSQFVIPQSLLVVPEHLTKREIPVNLTLYTSDNGGHSHEFYQGSTELARGSDHTEIDHYHEIRSLTLNPERDHNHSVKLNTITIDNALKVGDKVALLRQQGGQSYFILDRI